MTKAKYDNIVLDTAWKSTLKLGLEASYEDLPPLGATLYDQLASISSLGGTLTVEIDDFATSAPKEHAGGPGGSPPQEWVGRYAVIKFTANTLSGSDVEYRCVYIGDSYVLSPIEPPPFPPVLPYAEVGSATLESEIQVSGVYLRGQATDAVPGSRGFMWFGDRAYAESWFAGPNATFTAFGILPDGSTIGSEYTLGESDEFEIGSNWNCSVALSCDSFTGDGKVGPQCNDWRGGIDDTLVDVSKCVLYDPGTSIPDAGEPDWGRIIGSAPRYRIGPVSDGIGMWYDGTPSSPGGTGVVKTWGGEILMPFHATFKPVDGKFARN